MAPRSPGLPPRGRSPRALLDRVLRRFGRARALRRQRARPTGLDAHMLRDIGLTEDPSAQEARRVLWDVPDRWRR